MNVDFVRRSRVVEEIAKAVELYGPAHVDPGTQLSPRKCKNVYDDGTRCIAAQVLSQLGVEDWELMQVNDRDIEDTLRDLDLKSNFSEGAVGLLMDAQMEQDDAVPWGRILGEVPTWSEEF